MGFNNGYESGWEDAKTESAARIKTLEARIAELESGSGDGGAVPTPAGPVLKLDGLTVKEIVWPGGAAQYSGKFLTVNVAQEGEEGETWMTPTTTLNAGDIVVTTGPHPPNVDFVDNGYLVVGLGDAGVHIIGPRNVSTGEIATQFAPLSALVA